MSGPLGASQYMYSSGAADFYEYQIEKSARFDYGSYTSFQDISWENNPK